MTLLPQAGKPSYPTSPFNGIALVGEAWGEEEQRNEAPFIGPAGQELTRMLSRAGIDRSACFLTNLFNYRPSEHSNDLAYLCTDKLDCRAAYHRPDLPPYFPYSSTYDYPELARLPGGGYLHPRHLPALARLHSELAEVRPRVVVALGNVAIWALCRTTRISKLRGTLTNGFYQPDLQVLPTYHPAAILRQWQWRPVAILDLIKARRVAEGAHVRPSRKIFVAEGIGDLDTIRTHCLSGGEGPIGTDIETAHGCITCLSFAPSSELSFVVPFVDKRQPAYAYWPSALEEQAAWRCVQDILMSPRPKVFHHAPYDVPWLNHRHRLGINSRSIEDTLLLHHALYIEMEKSLRFLGSIYTDEAAWKDMRAEAETGKRSDSA
jgi:uracil-DNA glycosylase